ncbi:DUF2510 domain-containing protein [Auraticoccus monumenti]|uniref:DUF2510 domain-containing protein n=1 Tax=Auraticoccus monumenti TaxID=675864 RepID=A0A1G6SJA3_9ACTN|nr:DUF2510 domain-containing protein [Auraticoccus monumenti]SDD16227.1 Protein of unknown function [Auraticoccus monumenti]
MPTPAGWYPDPEDHSTVRWWNGIGWTSWRAEGADATPPPHGGDPRTVATVVPTVDRERRHTLRTVLLAVLTLLLVLGVVGAFGATRRATSPLPGSSTSPTAYGSPSPATPDLALDDATRTLTLADEVVVRMPAEPMAAPVPAPGVELFEDARYSDSEIHPGWYVVALVGLLDDVFVTPDDPAATSRLVGERALALFYDDVPAGLEPSTGPLGTLPPERAALWTVEVPIEEEDVPTTSATVRVAVIALEDGRQVALISDVADDTPADAAAAIQGMWDGVELR